MKALDNMFGGGGGFTPIQVIWVCAAMKGMKGTVYTQFSLE